MTALLQRESEAFECHDEVALDRRRFMGSMADYPQLGFTMKAVRRAGERLTGQLILGENTPPEEQEAILGTFAIGHSWRDSHVYPMRSVRFSVRHKMRVLKIGGQTVARPKHHGSIVRCIGRVFETVYCSESRERAGAFTEERSKCRVRLLPRLSHLTTPIASKRRNSAFARHCAGP